MPLEEVRIVCSYKDTGELSEYVLDARQFVYIMKSSLTWGQFFNYLNAIAKSEPLTDEPKKKE